MLIDFAADPRKAYSLMSATIAPRPVAWVSTRSKAGVINLAPFSFFQMVTGTPPTLMISPLLQADGSLKDTTRNIIETGEFVVNLVPFSLAGMMNETSFNFPPDSSEVDQCGVATLVCARVAPPRVDGVPVSFECRVASIHAYPESKPSCHIILGEVLVAHVNDDIFDQNGQIDPQRLDLISRMGADWYGRIKSNDNFKMPRPQGQDKPPGAPAPERSVQESLALALDHHSAGRLPQAEWHYRQILAMQPQNADAISFLGVLAHQSGNHDSALESVRRAIAINPHNPIFHRNLGNVLRNTGNVDSAIVAYQKALSIDPNYPEALFDLGDCYRMQHRLGEAESAYRRAAAVKPDFAEAYVNLGLIQKEQTKLNAAEESLRKALEIDPRSLNAYNNLSVLFQERGNHLEAEASCMRALQIRPDFVPANYNLSLALRDMGRYAEAEASCLRVLQVEPDHADAQFHLSYLRLLKGDYPEGWHRYEYRWALPGHEPRTAFAEPLWTGDIDISGKTILLYAEQGYGDTLQFSRYASVLAQRGATVLLMVPVALKTIMARCIGVAAVFTGDEEEAPLFDFQCPLLSMPLACRTELTTIPAQMPYLSCEPASVHAWKERLGQKTVLRVGLVWAGSSRKHLPNMHLVDRMRSIHFDQLSPLLELDGVEFYSLQVGEEAKAQIAGNRSIKDFTGLIGDFHDTAALIENLDLVISVDTSVAHLVGAIGKPIWLLNRFNTCWRWLTDRSDSPWYPSMRIFRQPTFGDWASVIEEVSHALKELTQAPPSLHAEKKSPQSKKSTENSAAQNLQTALTHHQAGRLREAEVFYRKILEQQPNHADALHYLGMLAHQAGDNAAAVKLITLAMAAAPDNPLYPYNLGTVFRHVGDLQASIQSYRQAIALKENFADAYYKLGISFQQAKLLSDAESSYRQVLAIAPDYAGAYNNLGSVLRESGRLAEAEANFKQALHIKPDFADAYLNLGNVHKDLHRYIDAEINYRLALQIKPNYAEAHSNLGLALTALRRFSEAESCYRRALELQPDSVEIHTNLGFALVEQHKFSDAEISLRHALQLKPDFAEAYNNLGIVLRELRQHAASEASFRRALELDRGLTAANNNLGNLLTEFGRLAEAEICFLQALAVDPDYAEAHLNFALMLLQAGDYARGWKEYEYRWSGGDFIPMREFVEPIWLGETSLHDKSILLHAEQGYGDTLQFIRYAQLLADAGATVYAVVPPVLDALVGSAPGVASVYNRFEGLPHFDYHCPLMSLPFALQTQLNTIPATTPYLACSPAKIDRWQRKLGEKTKLRVGLTWAGSPRKDQPAAHLLDRQRSMHFDQIKALLEVPGIEFYSLQLGDDARAQVQGNADMIDYTPELHHFDDTAALMANLDLIISVDTAVVHLAGAIGKPVWLLNRYNTCWRWLADRTDSPWYPSLRIFRQPAMGDWMTVVDNIKAALEQRVRES